MPIVARFSSKGQVYISVIVAMGIFLILSQAVISLIVSGYDLISFTRARTTAKHLASEQIEIVRNMSYDDVGTVNGVPSGVLPQTQNIVRNGLSYTVETNIVYFDDPFDQKAPTDTEPNDYKRVQISVSWGGIAQSRAPVTYITNIAPQFDEEFTGGTIIVNVTDSNGNPVSSAEVQFYANTITPIVDTTQLTDSNGQVILPGAGVCTSCYQITVSKTGFSSDRTYATSEVPIPAKTHATVLEAQVTELTFSIDLTSRVQIMSRDSLENNFALLPGQTFRLRGNKIIGTDSSGQLIYKFDEDIITDSTGSATLETLEWDSYYLESAQAGRDISGTNPLIPLIINPDQEYLATYSSVPSSTHRLLAVFHDNLDQPISSVSALLKDDSGFEEIYQSSTSSAEPNYSQAFFDNLSEKNYTIYATASGFQEFTDIIFVTGFTTENIQLIYE